MLMYGTNLLSAADKMTAMSVADVYRMISQPDQALVTAIERLRAIKELDATRYAQMKRSLPYFVCGNFMPAFRRIDNFASTQCFVLDIDHLSDKGLDAAAIKAKVMDDGDVMMCFVSPGCDGIKLLFKLQEPCYDPGMFSLFYKVFARAFASRYSLEQVVDERTCDVTRACFLSCDADAIFNPDACAVDMAAWLPQDDVLQLFDIKHEVETVRPMQDDCEPAVWDGPDDEALERIKLLLSDKKRRVVKEEHPVFVPKILNEIIGGLKVSIEETGIVVNDVMDINYGKKLQLSLGRRSAELNLFYGKRGFTVVQSPKRGTSSELNQTAAELVECYLNECWPNA